MIGALTVMAGLVFAPARTGANVLIVSFYLLTLGLGAAFFVALNYVADGTWSIAFRRVPEAMTGVLPAAGGLVLLVLLAGGPLYPWTHETLDGFKGFWLDRPFHLVRAVVYLGVWLALVRSIVRHSRDQDTDGLRAHQSGNERQSAIFLVVFAVTFWLASVDWIMSLEPHWFSTMFGLYNFAGLFLTGLAAIAVLTIWLGRRTELGRAVTVAHYHDLGKLIFAFSTFWAYIWFCQYMLIWYVNNPEETVYFTRRLEGGWLWMIVLTVLLNWVVPFVVLMSRAAKRRPGILFRVGIVILLGRWVDLHVMIMPAITDAPPPIGFWEFGAILGGLGLFGLTFLRALGSAPMVPAQDVYLRESLELH